MKNNTLIIAFVVVIAIATTGFTQTESSVNHQITELNEFVRTMEFGM